MIKHAGPAAALVKIDCSPEQIRLEVSDDGRGAGFEALAGTGHGLLGMRERAAMVGGLIRVESGTAGFLIEATLPLERARTS